MPEIRIEPVDGDAMLRDWRYVHNLIIPTHLLSLDEIRERAQRNRLSVAYLGGVLVGCSTVRPPVGDLATATVIVRVLPEHRRQGLGREFHERELAAARALGAAEIETVVLASNPDGLRFAQNHGYVEVDRYVLPGDTVPYIDLRLAAEPQRDPGGAAVA